MITSQNNLVGYKIRRLSYRQLQALSFLCQTNAGLASSSPVGIKMGVVGKPLGGVFSSLSRQKVNGQSLVLPYGRGDEGRGLRWKLNTSLISIKSLAEIVNELLRSWGG